MFRSQSYKKKWDINSVLNNNNTCEVVDEEDYDDKRLIIMIKEHFQPRENT